MIVKQLKRCVSCFRALTRSKLHVQKENQSSGNLTLMRARVRIPAGACLQPIKSESLATFKQSPTSTILIAGFKSAPAAKGKVNRRVHKQPQAVEGVYSEGELYLLDASTRIVYSTIRDEAGDLVPVGVYNREQQDIEFKAVGEESEPDSLATPSTVRGHFCVLLTQIFPAKVSVCRSCLTLGGPMYARVPSSLQRFTGTGYYMQDLLQGTQPDVPLQRIREELPALEFSSEPDDHCETALEAYEHIKPLLLRLCQDLNKDACDLRIYDPYYCTGKTKKLLSELGFTQVYNECDPRAPCSSVQCSVMEWHSTHSVLTSGTKTFTRGSLQVHCHLMTF